MAFVGVGFFNKVVMRYGIEIFSYSETLIFQILDSNLNILQAFHAFRNMRCQSLQIGCRLLNFVDPVSCFSALCVIDEKERIHLRGKVPNCIFTIKEILNGFSPRPEVVIEATLNCQTHPF
jgi:hypothetical protein